MTGTGLREARQYPPGARSLQGDRLVVWDVDGTLTRTDTFVPFLCRVLGTAWPRAALAASLDVARHGGGRAGGKDALLRHSLAGRPVQQVQKLAEAYAAQLLSRGCRRDALARWAWHRERGDQQVLASASLGIYLRPLGRLLGARDVVATELTAVDGVLSGGRATPNCRGAQKARRVDALIAATSPSTVWAYSDSRSDAPTLALADVAVRVRPHRRLVTARVPAAGVAPSTAEALT